MDNNSRLIAAGVSGAVIAFVIAWALLSPTVDNDYVCMCTSQTGGNPDNAQVIEVNGPVGTCPHQNRNNNMFCD